MLELITGVTRQNREKDPLQVTQTGTQTHLPDVHIFRLQEGTVGININPHRDSEYIQSPYSISGLFYRLAISANTRLWSCLLNMAFHQPVLLARCFLFRALNKRFDFPSAPCNFNISVWWKDARVVPVIMHIHGTLQWVKLKICHFLGMKSNAWAILHIMLCKMD